MTELYLGELNMGRFPTLGDIVPGLIQVKKGKIVKTKTGIGQPGDWYTPKGLVVSRYSHKTYPVMVRTERVTGKQRDDPQFGLVEAVIKALECKKACDPVGKAIF